MDGAGGEVNAMRAKLAFVILYAVASNLFLIADAQTPAAPPDFRSVVIRMGKAPGPIAIADVNHDRKADIIVGNMGHATDTASIADGKGDASTDPHTPRPCNATPN